MAIRRVLKMGDPRLRERAREVTAGELADGALRPLLADMQDTLRDYGGIGLAAPQIGEGVRVAIIEIAGGPTRYGELAPLPLTAFINPTITVLDAATAGYWEGCLSVPGLRGYVERPQHVQVDYTAVDGREQQLELQGFSATVFQHEFDHLDGTLYIDRIADTRLLAFEREYERFHFD